jgi:methionine-rich copper-binding protein CopC
MTIIRHLHQTGDLMNLKWATSLLAVLAAAGFTIVATEHAEAHARYASSTPARGEILATGPEEVEITFTQEIQRIEGKYGIEVTKDRGPSVAAGPAVVNDDDRTKMSVPLQPDLADGRYVVRWNNVSDEDGDPAEGAFSFYINYEPNAVDLENDAQLALIGEEATPASTPDASSTEPPVESPAIGDTPAPQPTPSTEDDGDDSSNTSVILIVVGSVIGAAVLVGLGYWFLRGRS